VQFSSNLEPSDVTVERVQIEIREHDAVIGLAVGIGTGWSLLLRTRLVAAATHRMAAGGQRAF
jgi:hypothetical protein